MNTQFRNIVQQYLTSYIAPSTAPAGSGREGGYVGNDAPITPDVFLGRLREETNAFKANFWELDAVEMADLLAKADHIYRDQAYANWASIPLAGDAPPAVVAWQKEARETA
jgi:hypothetical protein